MDENNQEEFKKWHKRWLIIIGIIILVMVIALIAYFIPLSHKDYKFSVERYYTINDEGSLAIADIRVINESDEEYIFYITLNAYDQTDEELVGTGGGYIVASPNSDVTLPFGIESFYSWRSLANSYIKIDYINEISI